MLEKPDLQDQFIISRLQDEYGLQVRQLIFLPLGADVNTAVYRVVAPDERAYFVKLRKGTFDEITVAVPQFLKEQGVHSIIPPLETLTRQGWASLDDFKMILYPFVEGRDGYEVALSEPQWVEFGAALRRIHTLPIPPTLGKLIPKDAYSPSGRERVRAFLAETEQAAFDDPVAAKLVVFMKSKREEISRLVARAEELAWRLQAQSPERVLCHSDIHAGNLLIRPEGAGIHPGFYIVDWDNPLFAPKERDLAMVGGSTVWNSPQVEALFYQGYGQVEIDQSALAYYRYERIVQDISEYCKQLLLSSEGGQDREQGYQYFVSNFLPDHEIEIAWKRDRSNQE